MLVFLVPPTVTGLLVSPLSAAVVFRLNLLPSVTFNRQDK